MPIDQGNAAAASKPRHRKTRCPPLALTGLFCGGWMDAMPEVIFTHRVGSRPVGLEVVLEREEAMRLLREEVGAIFQLVSVSWDENGKAGIQLVPSRGCVELAKAE